MRTHHTTMEDLGSPARLLMALLLLGTVLTSQQQRMDYSGHQVIRVQPMGEDQLHDVMALIDDPLYEVDFWGEPEHDVGINHTSSLDLHLPPSIQDAFTSLLIQSHINWRVLITDIQDLIDGEQEDVDHGRAKRSAPDSMNTSTVDNNRLFYEFSVVGHYATHDEINDWLDTAEYAHPDIVKVITIGHSYEGRPLKVIRIGSPANRALHFKKPSIWLDAGIHGREWVAPATATYIIHKLVSQYGRCRCVTHLVNTLDWYILPVANPDGYNFSHDVDRLWRKTRRPVGDCIGVDANRNFDYHWMRFNRCLSIFPGEYPFSEPETRAMSEFILEKRDVLKAYISLHSYSQMWLHPWGYSREMPPDYDDIVRVANRSVRALRAKHGMEYMVGSPAEILYPAPGTSMDWAAGAAGIKYSVSVELRDTGTFGFLLPSSEIIPTAQEAWAGLSAMAKEILKEL